MFDVSNWQMKLLLLNDIMKVVCVVFIVCVLVCDSYIWFYIMDWKEFFVIDFLLLVFQMNDFFIFFDFIDYDFIDVCL